MPGNVDYHPVIDYLDRITQPHRLRDPSDLYDDSQAGTGHDAWRWDDVWFVNLNVKPGWKLEYIEQTSSNTMRIVDAHSSIQFLQDFLLTRTNNARRQIVIVAHYPITSDRIDDEERKRFCKLIHDAQNATGDFEAAGKKLSPTWPTLAYLHGPTHSQPNHHDCTCPSPYAATTIPQFSVGTPLYGGTENAPGSYTSRSREQVPPGSRWSGERAGCQPHRRMDIRLRAFELPT